VAHSATLTLIRRLLAARQKKKPSTKWKALRSRFRVALTKELVGSDHQEYGSGADGEAYAEPGDGIALLFEPKLGEGLSDERVDSIPHGNLLLAQRRRELGRMRMRTGLRLREGV
jgi:hypothetical protein